MAALFNAVFTALYKTELNTVFIRHAGRTTDNNSTFNFVGNPTVLEF